MFNNTQEEMIQYQLMNRGITNPNVLESMRNVRREKFVPSDLIAQAYDDGPLPIGEHQTISQPYIVALMTELLELKSDDKVLEIGTGSGYQAAILAELTKQVYSVEPIAKLADCADKLLKELGYDNIKIKVGNGYKGWPEYALFDAIIVTCAPEEIPPALIEQLKSGGRMVIPVGPEGFGQTLWLIKKQGKNIIKEDHGSVIFVPMVED